MSISLTPGRAMVDIERDLEHSRESVRRATHQFAEAYWNFGRLLNEGLEQIPKADRRAWIAAQSRAVMSERVAYRCMRLYRHYQLADIQGQSARKALADIATPREEGESEGLPETILPHAAKTPEPEPPSSNTSTKAPEPPAQSSFAFTDAEPAPDEYDPFPPPETRLAEPATEKPLPETRPRPKAAERIDAQAQRIRLLEQEAADLRRHIGHYKQREATRNDADRPELMERLTELRNAQAREQEYIGGLLSLFAECADLWRETGHVGEGVHEYSRTPAGRMLFQSIKGGKR